MSTTCNRKPKVALVTCYFQHNYGSQLQAYATQVVLDKMGIQNETICIDGLRKEIKRAKYKYFLSRVWDRNTISDKFSTVRKIWALMTKGREFKQKIFLRDSIFDEFSQSMFHLSKRYSCKAELSNESGNYDAFIVGSDQLWLPSNIEADYYTLNFVPTNVAKISLATSFGVLRLPSRQARKASKFLSRMNYISVREAGGKKLLMELTGREVPVVCDPTILLKAEEWEQITSKQRRITEPYIFCYFLGNNPKHRDFARRMKAEKKYKIVQLQHCDEYIRYDEGFPDYAPYDIGPKEFIQLIRDAEYVLTDSFHCTVFSMIYRKPFFTFRRYSSDNKVSTNGRLYDLLSQMQLSHRMLTAAEDVRTIINEDIDFTSVHERLQELRHKTEIFLTDALMNSRILSPC